MIKLVLGLGSNIGNRRSYLKKAVKKICYLHGFDFLGLSSIYESEPWGFKKQNNFLNCVLVCLCKKSPRQTMKMLKDTERLLGRKNRGKWKAREIDIDILFYGDRVINKDGLIVPHPYLHLRNFVLRPLVELMPGFVHPSIKKNIEYLYNHSPDKSIVNLFSEKL
jgi:2-amino-4-hydroxy-6-hydroxymethyldihydropteridine diphosphokinase